MNSVPTRPSVGATVDDQTDGTSLGIHWVLPHLAGHVTVLDRPRVVLGRDAEGPRSPGETEVSRQHAEVCRTGTQLVLRDLGSTNGTFVNGKGIREQALRERDVVRLGDWVGIVISDAAAVAAMGTTFQTLAPGLFGGPDLVRALEPARAVAADNRLPVVLEGETGTGKECVARALHGWSGRTGPFVAINGAAIPEAMAEAELFGHRRGAFTGAERSGTGHLRAAHGGTLLLDEVVDLPLGVQGKLLRVLEQREVVPLGETVPIPIDVRVISAAQTPLAQAVENKRFRADLLARLDGVTVRLPPLRERIREVPFLFMQLLAQHSGGQAPRVSPRLIEQLCLHDWPFNVREIDLLARRLIVVSGREPLLRRSHLPERMRRGRRLPEAPPQVREGDATSRPDESGTDDVEALAGALRKFNGNVARAAAALGISRQRAYRLIETSTELDLSRIRQGDATDEP